MKKLILISLVMLLALSLIAGCSPNNSNKVVIYSSSDENEIALMRKMLDAKFPKYDIRIEYLTTGNHAAKLKAEGTKTEADISYDLEYGYLETLDKDKIFTDLSKYDRSIFVDDLNVSSNFIPTLRYGGAIMVNTKVLAKKGLSEPASYQDLLKPEYKGLISMPNPKSSGTGYMFYKSLVNTWGEASALKYFDDLSKNILQFTSSGSGPVNSLVQEEIAIAIGMTSHAALKITEGNPIKILIFKEGSPYQACGTAIIKGKDKNAAVKEVFKYLYDEVTPEICAKLYPEQIYKGKTFTMKNYPTNIKYADMSNNTPSEKERLLGLWKY